VTESLTELKNIGPTIEKRLNEIGIHTVTDLEKTGPVKAYQRICRAYPNETIPVCYYLYSLQGALMGVHWDAVPEEIKNDLYSRAKHARRGRRRSSR
jgi:DNA transformation protein